MPQIPKNRPHPSWFVVILAAVLTLVLMLQSLFGWDASSHTADYLVQFHQTQVVLSGVVAKDPDISSDKTSLTLKDLALESPVSTQLAGKAYISFSHGISAESPLQRSDRVALKGVLRPGFGNYVAALSRPDLLGVSRPEPGDWFLALRQRFAESIRAYIPAPESGLELGYLLGMRDGIESEFEEALRVVGLTHIIVASGTHLGIIVGACRKLFGRLSRLAGLIFATLCTLVFVGITGLTPSMMRAAFVSELLLIAWYFGRDAAPWRILLFALTVTLMIDPQNFNELAWQLSFGSFSGLLLLSSILTRFFYGSRAPGFIGASLITSLSTLLCCAPIMLYSFGSLSLLSFISNPLVLPTIPFVMCAGCLTGVLGLFGCQFLARLAGAVTTLVIRYHFFVVNSLSSQKIFLLELPKYNKLVFLLWLLPVAIMVISAISQRRRRRNIAHILASLSSPDITLPSVATNQILAESGRFASGVDNALASSDAQLAPPDDSGSFFPNSAKFPARRTGNDAKLVEVARDPP